MNKKLALILYLATHDEWYTAEEIGKAIGVTTKVCYVYLDELRRAKLVVTRPGEAAPGKPKAQAQFQGTLTRRVTAKA